MGAVSNKQNLFDAVTNQGKGRLEVLQQDAPLLRFFVRGKVDGAVIDYEQVAELHKALGLWMDEYEEE